MMVDRDRQEWKEVTNALDGFEQACRCAKLSKAPYLPNDPISSRAKASLLVKDASLLAKGPDPWAHAPQSLSWGKPCP
jgi:hypothetical protein